MGVFHSYRDVHSSQVEELRLGNLLSRFDAIIKMETDGIPDIIKDFFIGFSLCVTSLEFRAECGIDIFIFFQLLQKNGNCSY